MGRIIPAVTNPGKMRLSPLGHAVASLYVCQCVCVWRRRGCIYIRTLFRLGRLAHRRLYIDLVQRLQMRLRSDNFWLRHSNRQDPILSHPGLIRSLIERPADGAPLLTSLSQILPTLDRQLVLGQLCKITNRSFYMSSLSHF